MLSLHDIALGYSGETIADNVSLSLEAGQICAVIGHNGAGKSTLLRTIMGLQPPLAGRIAWTGAKPRTIGYLGRSTEIDCQFPVRIKDVVAMGAWNGLDFWTGIDSAKTRQIDDALARTGLAKIADRPLFECSSGQLQRCFFARAIVQDAPILLLDEPFLAIDQTTQAQLVEIIQQWRAEGRAILIVLHDLSAVMTLSDSCLLIGRHRARFGQTTQIITRQNLLSHDYITEAQASLLSLPESAGECDV